MANVEAVRAVIAANKSRQARARKLNLRAGKQVFPVLNQTEMENWLRERLGNVVSVGSISDPEKLRLPELEAKQIATVISENPDTITVVDWDADVSYDAGNPSITLLGGDRIWMELPDEGVRLPGGREVRVVVPVGFYQTVSDTDILRLKGKVREHLNAQQWDGWTKPEIAVPDLGAEDVAIPDITTVQYGTCVVDGTPLTAYGTLVVNLGYYWATDARFRTGWFRTREEAEQAREVAVAKLDEIRVAERERRELQTVKATAEALKARLGSLYQTLYYNESVDRGLRDCLYSKRYGYLPADLMSLKAWIADISDLVEEAEEASSEVDNRNARCAQFEEASRNFGRGQAHVLVDGSLVLVNCGKQSKLGSFEVDPRGAPGSRQSGVVSLDADRKNCVWQVIPVGQRIQCRDYSARGGLNSEATFVVPVGLSVGVWAVGEDDNGKFFFPVIYFDNGREVVPEKMEVVREPLLREDARKATATSDLLSKWGSGNRNPPKIKTAGRR